MSETRFYDYRAGTDVVVEMGAMKPFGRRVLCRSVFASDAYAVQGGGKLHVVQHNSTDADCFEVLALGDGVGKWCQDNAFALPRVGQHADVRSTAADRVNQKDPTGRYWLVPIEDVTALWDPIPVDDKLIAVIDAVNARLNDGPPAAPPLLAGGPIELVPR